jgi:hypothetical protein
VSNGNEGHSRRQVLTTVGRLSTAGAMGQAIASSPAAATQPNSEIAEKTFEATADNVVNTLEAAYGVNRGARLPARHEGPGGQGERCFRRNPSVRLISDKLSMKRFWVAAVGLPLLCSPAFAQVEVGDPLAAMPTVGVTSPLGISPGGSVGATGIPLGATELTSPGLSPTPTGGVTGTIAIPTSGAITTSGTTCSTGGISPSGMYGSTASYDGGGMAVGTVTPATAATTDPTATPGTSTSSQMLIAPGSTSSGMLDTSGMSGMCGSGSSSIALSSTPTSTAPTVPGGGARTGIPLGSYEIGNLGVSSVPAVPTISVLPITGSVGSSAPPVAVTTPTVTSPTSPAALLSPITITASGNTLAPGLSPSGSTLGPTGTGSGLVR